MGLADDLLHQANHLATYEGLNPSQASLRRAVSTAYYALFHLLTEDAALRWSGSQEAITGLERGFQHSSMKIISTQFRKESWLDWHNTKQLVPEEVWGVATAFVDLQEERHTADYDNHEHWTITEVQATLNTVRLAFQQWRGICTHPMAASV